MSDLRLNYSITKFESFLDILSDLANAQNKKNYALLGWGKRVLNYGLKQSDFNSKDFVSTEKQFRDYKMDLEVLRFIERYGKNQRVKRGPKYAITPFGLFFLLKHRNQFTVNSVFDYFSRISHNKLTKISPKSWKFYNEKEIDKAVKMLFDNMDFVYDNENLIMTLYAFNPNRYNKTVLTQVIISQTYIKVTKPKPLTKDVRDIVTVTELDFGLAYFFRNLLCYYLFINTPKKRIKDIPKEFRLFFILILHHIQNETALDFHQAKLLDTIAYGSDDPKLVSLLTKEKFNRIIDGLN
jgi:hypothetical protein